MQEARDFAPEGAFRSLAYRALWQCAQAFHRAGRACMYAAAGLLRKRDLDSASRLLWRDYGTLIADVDGGLDAWEARMYDAVLRPSDRILLAGCGAGRDLLALCERGYQVTGLDPTPELVALARGHLARRGFAAHVLEGFVEAADLAGEYDVVVLAGNAYSFIPTAPSRIATLVRIRGHLASGGRIVITYGGVLRPPSPGITVTSVLGRLSGADWRAERGDAFSADHYKRRLLRYEHRFAAGDVARECSAAGLRVDQEVATSVCYAVAVRSTGAAPFEEPLRST